MTTLEQVRARFARGSGLPFAHSLTESSILDALSWHGVQFRDRLFSPVTTLWGFLSQVLGDDHSGRDTVSRIIARRAAAGLEVCSPNTARYCNARARIPTAVPRSLARRTAQHLQAGLDASISDGQMGDLYERRWAGEVDIRSIKSTKMDILRCKTPLHARKPLL